MKICHCQATLLRDKTHVKTQEFSQRTSGLVEFEGHVSICAEAEVVVDDVERQARSGVGR